MPNNKEEEFLSKEFLSKELLLKLNWTIIEDKRHKGSQLFYNEIIDPDNTYTLKGAQQKTKWYYEN